MNEEEYRIDPDLDKLRPYITALDKKPPKAKHVELTNHLKHTIGVLYERETLEEKKVRESILINLRELINKWVMETLKRKNIPNYRSSGGELFVSGSYRQNVNSKYDDVDTICCVPKYISREDFFSEEKEGFLGKLKQIPQISHVMAIKSAVVPIIEVVWSGIDLDVLMARLERTKVPKLDQILDDRILVGLDDQTVRSINGPRVTELIIKLVPNYENFALVLRCVRHWAKQRGIYSNKLGYLGGVNWGILVAFCCQLYPTSSPSKLLATFFNLYHMWKWPTEVRLVHPYNPEDHGVSGLNLRQWDPSQDRSEAFHIMPIITPAYPNQNSSFNVSNATLDIMLDEFLRAKMIADEALNTGTETILKPPEDVGQKIWGGLFEKSEFFVRFGSFIEVKAFVKDAEQPDDLNRWTGLVESRLRKLVENLQRFPLRKIYTFPKKFKEERKENVKDDEEQETGDAEVEEGVRWYIGILRHPNKLANRKRLDFSYEVKNWVDSLYNFNDLSKEKFGVRVVLRKWSDLPDVEEMFPNGKKEWIKERKIWIYRMKEEQDELRKHNNPNYQLPRRAYPRYTDEEYKRVEKKDLDVEIVEDKKEGVDKQVDIVENKEEEMEEKEDTLALKRLNEESETKSSKRRMVKVFNMWDMPPLPGIDVRNIDTFKL
eukprot:snap_masked-scaffold_16-processed-gene-4.30-mRNA-1 protein AED:0.09 eAED:0.09 QI:0/-1/0/1/-1/1/1/0/659